MEWVSKIRRLYALMRLTYWISRSDTKINLFNGKSLKFEDFLPLPLEEFGRSRWTKFATLCEPHWSLICQRNYLYWVKMSANFVKSFQKCGETCRICRPKIIRKFSIDRLILKNFCFNTASFVASKLSWIPLYEMQLKIFIGMLLKNISPNRLLFCNV